MRLGVWMGGILGVVLAAATVAQSQTLAEKHPLTFDDLIKMHRVLAPEISRDGRWVAYSSDDTGLYEIYVQPFPGPGGKKLISTQGGIAPSWRGREIFFRTPANELAMVDVQTNPTIRVSRQQIVFKPVRGNGWDVAPDGKRFLLVAPPDTGAPGGRLVAVGDWFEELRRLVHVGGK